MTTYYVSKTGNNGNGLSLVNAKTTIAAGIALMAASDTLMINDGVYAEGNLSLPVGASGNHAIMQAINRNAAIIRPTVGGGVYCSILFINNYNTIDGLFCDGANFSVGYAPIYAGQGLNLHHLYVLNGTATHSRGDGTGGGEGSGVDLAQARGGNNIVRNMNIYDNGALNVHADHSIYLGGSNNLIEGNLIWGSIAEGEIISVYDISQTVSGTIIRNNKIYNNVNSNSGITVASSVSSIEIYNNIIYNNARKGIFLYGSSVSNALIANNTIYGNGEEAINIDIGISNTIVRNNIFRNNGTDGVADFGTSTTQDHNQTTDPSFVTPGSDFHLQSTSNAIGAGLAVGSVTTDFDGITRPNPPSIGAFEAPSGSIPTGPLLENFDGYTTGVSIDGLNTGTGWTQSWDLTVGVATVEVAGGDMSGRSLKLTSTSQVNILRRMAAHIGEFNISFKIRCSITNPDSDGIGIELLEASDATVIAVFFNSSGNIISQVGTILVAGFVANQAYKIIANFNTSTHANQVRFSVDNGATFTAWESTSGAFISIDGFAVGSYSTNAHTFDVDDINDDVITVIPPNNAILLGDCLT